MEAMGVNQVHAAAGRNAAFQTGLPSFVGLGKKGDRIEGIILDVSNRVSIYFNGNEVSVSQSAIKNATAGEFRMFEIMDVTEQGYVLKEVEQENVEAAPNIGVTQTKVEMSRTSFDDKLEQAAKEKKEKEEAPPSGSEVMKKLDDFGNRMTAADYHDIEQEGFSIESYNLERLERVLNRIKEQKEFKEDAVERSAEKQQKYDEQVQKIVISNVVSNVVGSSVAKQIAQRLDNANLPVTASNIKKVANLLELSAVAADLSDKAMSYLIDNELPPTIENIYQAQYAGSGQKYENYVPDYGDGFKNKAITYKRTAVPINKAKIEMEWQAVKPQVEKSIENAGLEVNEEALKQAKWLFTNDLPITEETIVNMKKLQELKEGYDQDKVLEQIVRTYSKGQPMEATDLTGETMIETKQRVENFVSEIDEKLNSVHIEDGDDFTFLSIDDITARRQMEEIRLRMTMQAGQKLLNQGIELNTKGLQNVVNKLREIETNYYRGVMRERGLPDDNNRLELVRRTAEQVNDLKNSPSYVLGITLNRKSGMTVTGLHQAATSLKVQLDRAGAAYNTLLTRPMEELGDSFIKALGSVDQILDRMGLEPTLINRRAVKILGNNQMPITEENITAIKEYDDQVNTLLKNMHPAVTVEMIKKGINPLNTPIEELNEKIAALKEEMGITGEEKYSKYLFKAEREMDISPDEKKAYIGIYRLLNNVQKTNGAAIGQLIHADKEVTLKNLLSAVTTIKTGKIEQTVGDYRELEQLRYTKETLFDQLNKVFEEGKPLESLEAGKKTGEETAEETETKYLSNVVDNIVDEITPKKIDKMVQNLPTTADKLDSLMNKSVEKLLDEMQNDLDTDTEETDLEYEEKMIDQIRNLSENCEEATDFLNSYRIPVSIKNLFAANQLLGEGSFFKSIKEKTQNLPADKREKIEKTITDLVEGLEDEDTIQEKYQALESAMEELVNEEYSDENVTSKDLAGLQVFTNSMRLVRTLAKKQRYEIPIITDDNITNVHLTVISGGLEQGKVEIGIQSEKLGNIRAEFAMNNNELIGLVAGDSARCSQALKGGYDDLEWRLENAGIRIGSVNYGIDHRSTDAYKHTNVDSDGEKADTRQLYQAAKAFIQNVAMLEGLY